MAHDVTMPKVAMAMNEGKISEWLKSNGDFVEKGEQLFSIETEKTAYEVEATESGFLHIIAEEGAVVPVHEVVAKLAADESGETADMGEVETKAQTAPAEPSTPTPDVTPPMPVEVAAPIAAGPARTVILASPLARRIAKMRQLDLSQIKGTGPGGRIKKRDIEAHLAAGGTMSAPAPARVATVPSSPIPAGPVAEKTRILVSGMRKAIRDGMMQAHSQQAMCPGAIEIEMEAILDARQKFVERADHYGTRVSPQAFFVKALSLAAREVPIANSAMGGEEIVVFEDINVGIAIAVEGGHEFLSGLVVPVIRNADRKGLVEIDKEFKTLVAKAQAGTLSPDDTSGGTITISSVAGIIPGWSVTAPVLNSGQCYIGQPGNIVDRPVVRDGELVPGKVMTWSYNFDHRSMDGVPVCELHTRLKDFLENPEQMLA